jgi:hypothetical protein
MVNVPSKVAVPAPVILLAAVLVSAKVIPPVLESAKVLPVGTVVFPV